jgi:hypothetical protein
MSIKNKAIAGGVVVIVLAIAGAVLLKAGQLSRACTAVTEADQRNYDAARDAFERANMALSSRNYSTANDLMDMAISNLGYAYGAEPGQDDTDTVMAAARDVVARSDFQLAAHMKQDVVRARFAQFQKKASIAHRCHSVLKKIGLG